MPKKNSMKKKQKQQQKKRPSRKKRPATRRVVNVRQRGPGVSRCGAQYFIACAAPFDARAIGACVPITPCRPSAKYTVRKRLNLMTGTSGVGYFALAPCVAAATQCCFGTGPGYAGGVSTPLAPGDAGMLQYNLNFPYTYADCIPTSTDTGAYVEGRIISYGVRWRYTGTALNRGGRCFPFVSPNHDNLMGMTPDQIMSFTEVSSYPMVEKWNTISISAIDAIEQNYPSVTNLQMTANTEAQYHAACYPFSAMQRLGSINGNIGGCPLVVVVVAPSLDPMPFEVEIIAHVEYVGRHVQSNISPSHTDPVAAAHTAEAASSTLRQQVGSGLSWTAAMAKEFIKTYHEIDPGFIAIKSLFGGSDVQDQWALEL